MFLTLFSLLGIAAGTGLYFLTIVAALLLPIVCLPVVGVALIHSFLSSSAEASTVEVHTQPVLKPQEQIIEEIRRIEKNDTDFASEIETIELNDIPELLEHLPYNGWHDELFERESNCWRFTFKYNSARGKFSTTAVGQSPTEAFQLAKQILGVRIRRWHDMRFQPGFEESQEKFNGTIPLHASPHVLIVEDDVDLALAMKAALSQLGCEADVATRFEGLSHKISFSKPDIILMDWMLNDHTTAGNAVELSTRLIGTFADLREHFRNHKSRVVTFSALEREKIHMPKESAEFFEHFDHWRKPLSFPELVTRAAGLIECTA